MIKRFFLYGVTTRTRNVQDIEWKILLSFHETRMKHLHLNIAQTIVHLVL